MGKAIALVVLVCAVPLCGWAQGYYIQEARIVVEGKEQWDQWEYPEDLVEINQEGWIKPRFFRKNINACSDAYRFTHQGNKIDSYRWEMETGGARKAGSNLEGVAKVMDGDLSTYWEPDENDPLTDWWFEIDVGRLVTATKVVLRFVEEGQGDPFLHFRVWTSSGFRVGGSSRNLEFPRDYRTLWKTTQPNEEDRLFEFDLVPFTEESHIQYVRVQVWDTKGDKREELSREEYERLAPDGRGRIEYYRITAAGEEELTDKEGYEKLSSEQKGPIRYYRRERPRLAEVEVWSLGDNVAMGVLKRGGRVDFVDVPGRNLGSIADMFDGKYATGWNVMSPQEKDQQITVDLGAMFWVNAIHLVAPRKPLRGNWVNPPMEGPPPPVRVSDVGIGSLWRQVPLDASFGPYRVRAVEVRFPPPPKGPANTWVMDIDVIREMQIYGEGYPSDILLTLDPIEVGGHRVMTSVEWTADTPAGTSVEVQTRTGDRVREEKHYFNQDGIEVTELYWKYRLPSFMRGPVKSVFIPGSDWSPWSRPYEHSGDPFQSPSPKKYLQIRVKLLSDDPYQAPSLKSLSIPFTTPLTETISGTISPREVQRLGAPELFTLKIHPTLQPWHPGFNQLLIQTLDRMEVKLVKMEIKKDSTSTDLTDQVKILPTQPDSLWTVFPDTIQTGDTEEIELQFQSALYRDSTPFNVFVGNTSLPNVWQQVESEDFHPFLHTFIVFVPLDKKMIDNVEIIPSVLTPNGDGVHDVMTIHFTVGRIKAPRDVRVTIYDLRGNSVRHMVERREKYPLGKYAMEWDGRDDRGGLVKPGMYVVVLRVHSNWEEARNTEVKRRVHVVY